MDRVQKIIANAGVCSRRKAEELIEKKLVRVNGKIVKLGDGADEKDKITINNRPLAHANKRYLVMNKPLGYTTTM